MQILNNLISDMNVKKDKGEEMSILVFDMGGTAVKYGVWDETLKDQSSFPTPETWLEMTQNLKSVQEKLSERYRFTGVAISAPGSVDAELGIIGGISAIEYIHNFNIKDELENLFGLPVSLENDANSAALAEVWLGSAKDVNDALFVVIGTGIGGAVIQDRKLLKGKNLFAGEFGIMMLNDTTSFSHGATAFHMARRYCERMNLKQGSLSGKDIFELAEQEDKIAQEEVDKFYYNLSLGIYNIMFTTDPETIILGGGVTQHKPLVGTLKKYLDKRLKDSGLESYNYDLQSCTFLNDANLVGAVYAHLNQYGGI